MYRGYSVFRVVKTKQCYSYNKKKLFSFPPFYKPFSKTINIDLS